MKLSRQRPGTNSRWDTIFDITSSLIVMPEGDPTGFTMEFTAIGRHTGAQSTANYRLRFAENEWRNLVFRANRIVPATASYPAKDPKHLADAYIKLVKADHYLLEVVRVDLDTLDEVEQVLIARSNAKGNKDRDIERALDLVQTNIQNRRELGEDEDVR